MDKENLKSQITDIVYNSLDMCGSSIKAVKEYCKESGIEYTQDIEQIIFYAQDEYFKHGL